MRQSLTWQVLLVTAFASLVLPRSAWAASRAHMVAAGTQHTCAVTRGGGVKCWGLNDNGQLGDGTTTDRATPTDVSGLTSAATAVAAGQSHTCILTAGGGVQCFGANLWGQLGDGTTTSRLTPVPVSGLTTGATAMATGIGHTCALTTGGGVLCWGSNGVGQLGDGTLTDRATPTAVYGLSTGVAAVAAGLLHTCAVTDGGHVLCWGGNGNGQLGNGTTSYSKWPTPVTGLSRGVAAAAPGYAHTCAVTTGGSVGCWGFNQTGQLGDGSLTQRLTPVRIRQFGQPDVDGDERGDIVVYRPSSGTWFVLPSSTNYSSFQYLGWGVETEGDTPVLGDFDGDGLLDGTVFRPGTGTWFILKSSSGYADWEWFGWGAAGDTLVAGDYDGDGITDAAVYRASTGTWYVRPSSGAAPFSVVFGGPGDEPVDGDFDGDGKRDPAVYRASTGTWFWLKSSANYAQFDFKGWGVQVEGDTPAPGDYDGDGKTDPCVFRPWTGTWIILDSHAGYTTWNWFGWGTTGDKVVPANFDADGLTDGAVYRPSTGEWWVRPSSGSASWYRVFGGPGDLPLIAVW